MFLRLPLIVLVRSDETCDLKLSHFHPREFVTIWQCIMSVWLNCGPVKNLLAAVTKVTNYSGFEIILQILFNFTCSHFG